MPITFLTEAAYLGYYNQVAEQGVEATHMAVLETVMGTSETCYVKLFRERDPATGRYNRGLVNEVAGYVLAEKLGLPVAPRGGLIRLSYDQLTAPPDWLAVGETTVAWWSADLNARSVKAYFNLSAITPSTCGATLAALASELLANSQVPSIIAFDGWVANTDRNVGNLIRFDNGQYVLIDHGWALTGPMWTASDLVDPAINYRNTLLEILGSNGRLLPFRHRVQKAFEDLMQHSAVAITSLTPLLSSLLPTTDVGAAERFLSNRSGSSSSLKRLSLMV